MRENYVTKKEFKIAMTKIDRRFIGQDKKFKSIDKKFGSVDERFKSIDEQFEGLRGLIVTSMKEQRVHFEKNMERYIGALTEDFNHKIDSIFEHPVFANYRA